MIGSFGFGDGMGVEFNGSLGGGSFEENEPTICKWEG